MQTVYSVGARHMRNLSLVSVYSSGGEDGRKSGEKMQCLVPEAAIGKSALKSNLGTHLELLAIKFSERDHE